MTKVTLEFTHIEEAELSLNGPRYFNALRDFQEYLNLLSGDSVRVEEVRRNFKEYMDIHHIAHG